MNSTLLEQADQHYLDKDIECHLRPRFPAKEPNHRFIKTGDKNTRNCKIASITEQGTGRPF